MRVGLYARVSTNDQSVELQTRELTEYVKARGWAITEIYEDHGFSGKNTERPALRRLLEAVNRRQIDVVVVWKLDRFARSLSDLINMVQDLTERGVDFISLKDNLDLSTSQGRLLLGLLGSFAQFERDLIVERVRAGLINARRKGKRLGRPLKRNDQAIRELRTKGLSLRAIAAKLGVSKAAVQRGCTENPRKSDVTSA